MYKLRAPTDIEIVEIIVPIHFPNSIPDNRSNGVPKPNRTIQIIENIKKSIRLNVSNSALKTVDFKGGLDDFLKSAKNKNLSRKAKKLKFSIAQKS